MNVFVYTISSIPVNLLQKWSKMVGKLDVLGEYRRSL